MDYGYEAFIAQIGTVVLGRRTYDQIPSFGVGWPYPGRRGLVVTSRPLAEAYPGVSAWTQGIEPLIPYLRDLAGADVWVVGGAQLQWAFIEAGALDVLELFLIPVLLGDGVKLFPKAAGGPRGMVLHSVASLPKGMAHLTYGFF